MSLQLDLPEVTRPGAVGEPGRAGEVTCLQTPSGRSQIVPDVADCLAAAAGASVRGLSLEAAPRRPRRRLEHVAAGVGGQLVVAPAARTAMGQLLEPERTPALARAAGATVVLVCEDGRGLSGDSVVCAVTQHTSPDVLVRADELADLLGVRLALVHARPPLPSLATAGGPAGGPPPPGAFEPSSREADWQLLERARDRVGGIPAIRLIDGRPAAVLNECGERLGACAIVIAAPSTGALMGVLLDSPAYELARTAAMPLAVIPVEGKE